MEYMGDELLLLEVGYLAVGEYNFTHFVVAVMVATSHLVASIVMYSQVMALVKDNYPMEVASSQLVINLERYSIVVTKDVQYLLVV